MSAEPLRIEDLPHYTYDDYSGWEGRWELIRGIPFAMTPAPVIKHQRISAEIIHQLKALLDDCGPCEVLPPVDWQITEDTVVQPDALVVCAGGEDIGTIKLEKTPVMVFEILSPSTSHKDKVVKYRLYEGAGVKYYCIVDPDHNDVMVFTLQKEKYGKMLDAKDGWMDFDLGPCRIRFNFNKIFKTF